MTTLKVPELTMDPLQRAAAEAGEGPMVILGGPGTGKTHTIIARVALLLRGGASPHTITCLTFNSQGAEDLRRQMEKIPPTAESAPHIFIGTIHHYASFYLQAGRSRLPGHLFSIHHLGQTAGHGGDNRDAGSRSPRRRREASPDRDRRNTRLEREEPDQKHPRRRSGPGMGPG